MPSEWLQEERSSGAEEPYWLDEKIRSVTSHTSRLGNAGPLLAGELPRLRRVCACPAAPVWPARLPRRRQHGPRLPDARGCPHAE